MSLRVRQPYIINPLEADGAQHLRNTLALQPEQYEALAQDGDAPTLVEWTENRYPGLIASFGKSLLPSLVDDAELGAKIIRLRWRLLDFTRQKHELLLGDNPCIFLGGKDAPKIVALPVSPTKAFLATRSERAAATLLSQDRRTLAVRLNESSLLQARTRIYARNAGALHRKPPEQVLADEGLARRC